eukprot:TRINITY_DN8935_c0_g2_i1.p2 TRINITY_DN8935_c0_g2~~TRINITY_DN8935_c0_g2_i1.p2  ORF type:complete len:208 (-),score=26.47 TRINITY_DN8935_c0_g2_i1:1096-1719(-)
MQNDLIEDLHYALAPLVARLRSQCGLTKSIEGFTFRPTEVARSSSRTKRVADMIVIDRELFQVSESFPRQPESLKETEVFGRLVSDLGIMLRQRGFNPLQDIPATSLITGKNLNFWLSDVSLQNCFGSENTPQETDREPSNPSKTSKKDGISLESLAAGTDPRVVWLKAATEIINDYTLPEHRQLPFKSFEVPPYRFISFDKSDSNE